MRSKWLLKLARVACIVTISSGAVWVLSGAGCLPDEEKATLTPTVEGVPTPTLVFLPTPTVNLFPSYIVSCQEEIRGLLTPRFWSAYEWRTDSWCRDQASGRYLSGDYKEAAAEFVSKYKMGPIPTERLLVSVKLPEGMPSSLLPVIMQESLRLSLLEVTALDSERWTFASELINQEMLPALKVAVEAFMPEGFRCSDSLTLIKDWGTSPSTFSFEVKDSVTGRVFVWSPICTSFSEMTNFLQWGDERTKLYLEQLSVQKERDSLVTLLEAAEKDFPSTGMTAKEVNAVRMRKEYLETVVMLDLSQKSGLLQQKTDPIENSYRFAGGTVPFRDFISSRYEEWARIQRAKLGGDVWGLMVSSSGSRTYTLSSCGYFIGSAPLHYFHNGDTLQLGGRVVALAGTFSVSENFLGYWVYTGTFTLPTIPENPSIAWLLELWAIMEHPNCS
jgi:hypothetical protein